MSKWKQDDREINACVCGTAELTEPQNVSKDIERMDLEAFGLECPACGRSVDGTTEEEAYVMWDAAMDALEKMPGGTK